MEEPLLFKNEPVDGKADYCLVPLEIQNEVYSIPMSPVVKDENADFTDMFEPTDNSKNLFEGHEIKEEVVIGPTVLLKTLTDNYLRLLGMDPLSKQLDIKKEPDEDCELVSEETCRCEDLYNGHQVKQEEIIGPTVLHRIFIPPNNETNKNQLSDFSYEIRCEKLSVENKNGKKSLKENLNTGKTNLLIEKEVFKCKKCCKTFTFKVNLKRHIKEIHAKKSIKLFSCNICSNKFKRKSYLATHEKLHIPKDRTIINKEIITTKTLEKFICDFCKNSFMTKQGLNRHIRRHTGQKNYICDLCKDSFMSKWCLERHLSYHRGLGTGVSEYLCEICSKRFTRLYSLNRHLITHTGKKLFSCNNCGKALWSRWGCLCHERKCLEKK